MSVLAKLQLRERPTKKGDEEQGSMYAAKAKHAKEWQIHATDTFAASTDFCTEKKNKVKAAEKTVTTCEESSSRRRRAEASNHALIHTPVNGEEIRVKRSPNTPATAVLVRHVCIQSGWDGM